MSKRLTREEIEVKVGLGESLESGKLDGADLTDYVKISQLISQPSSFYEAGSTGCSRFQCAIHSQTNI